MRYFHIATGEWITDVELQNRLDQHFDFKCNDCKESIGEHIAVLAEGIFCKPCQQKILNTLTKEKMEKK
jgi:DNA-directed RNA polymerase subunit RPC12/RpoP|tara:strand:+ start:187 stop:393 length:207 start_codon:yes stop_codon:yes gene_type:complete